MGLEIKHEAFDEDDFVAFGERLERSLDVLAALLDRPDFGVGEASLGAELELSLIDDEADPLPLNREVIEESLDPRLTIELDRFNLECNLRHGPLAGASFHRLGMEFEDALGAVRSAASVHGGRAVTVGILPTLTERDLEPSNMSDSARFRALSASLRRLRRGPFRLHIDGEDPLDMLADDVTFEGAATSLQLHLRVDPTSFAPIYNAIQLATAPVLATAGNSPVLLGRRLWEETRIALFKQAVDHRGQGARRRTEAARVSFGSDWVESSVLELFAEAIATHECLLPVLSQQDPLAELAAGGMPHLEEMRLHQGTVWRWNRAIFDPSDGGHLRIEMRALPSGPTVVDMLANAAFVIGLAHGLAPNIEAWCQGMGFEAAHHNFYRAAQSGLEAELLWPRGPGAAPEPVRARDLIARLIPIARSGLAHAGVDASDTDRLLDVIENRAYAGRTGARWQRRTLDSLEPRLGRSGALHAMLERYVDLSEAGEPVHLWPLVEQGA